VPILSFSDIHNNVACVRKLRAQETNGYDVIAVAGDIGTHRAAEIFEILRSFRCPVVYVHGNWDRMPVYADFGDDIHLVHLRVVKIGRLSFTGYSFYDPEPISGVGARGEYARRCRDGVAKAIREAGVEPRRCVLMAHDRATLLDRELPGLLLHLYGHIHRFDVSQRAATTYVNVSALDRLLPVRRKPRGGQLSYVNAGNYAVIEVRENGSLTIECRLLARNYGGWEVVPHAARKRPPAGELIPEDHIFGDNVRIAEIPAARVRF
jgi:predicted phosphodiesterase